MSIPASDDHSERIPIPRVLHQLPHLLIMCHRLLFKVIILGLIRLSFLILNVFLVYLTIQPTITPVVVLRGEVLIQLYLPLVVAKDRLLFCCRNRDSVTQHIEAVELPLKFPIAC